MGTFYYIGTDKVTMESIYDLIRENKKLRLTPQAKNAIKKCKRYVDKKIQKENTPIYGINTGFGSLCDVSITGEKLNELQENLVMSHACGIGEEVPKAIVKLILFLKIQSLSYGYSGVRLETVERLVMFYNEEILPVIYTLGSLGASGDLAPLAHMALPLIGQGVVDYKGVRYTGAELHRKLNLNKIELAPKEGLALLNGTQFMGAYGIFILLKLYKLSYLADMISALSLEAFNGRMEPFDALVHRIRPHCGQVLTATRIRELIGDSELITRDKTTVQDPYSFRCIPQVHGASKDTMDFVSKTFMTEVNAVTDNPNVFVEADRIISGGNFHGQPLALALDFLGIAMAELGSISERRIYQLLSGSRGLPDFLITTPGLNSGFMISQYTAAAIVSETKQLATPASIDSIVSSNGQEDHVSMGANAATKAYRIVANLESVLAIELMNASQALGYRKSLKKYTFLRSFLDRYRTVVPFVKKDKVLHDDIENTKIFIENLEIDSELLFEC